MGNMRRLGSDKDMSVLLAAKGIEPKALFALAEEYGALSFDIADEEYSFWALEMYRRHLVSLQERGMDESVMHVELGKLDHLRGMSSAHKA